MHVLGLNAVTARNTGTSSVPVWSIIENIRDEALNLEQSLADITTRRSNGWRMQVGTLNEGQITAQMLYDQGDSEFQAIQNAWETKERILMGFFDADPGAASSTIYGLVGGFGVTNFSQSRGLEEAVMVDVTFTAREDDLGAGPSWTSIINA